jgi:glycosyltransferase involved in cell wall biosynthesis
LNTRLAIVLSHPVQYYSPWFRWIAKHTKLKLKVFYLSDAGVAPSHDEKFGRVISWDVDLLSGYDYEFVPNLARHPDTTRFSGLHNPALRSRLLAWKPEAILLFGYAYRSHLGLILRPPVPLIFRGDSHIIGQPRPSLLKRILLKLIYGQFAGITYVGRANREYFRAFHVPESKLHYVPHCVNAEHFQPTSDRRQQALALRDQLGLTAKRVILFAGKFVPQKQPLELLQSFISIATTNDALVLVGEGSEKPALEKLAAAHPEVTVHFLPFANQSEIPIRYLLADIFVLPSRGNYETWGLAVNEAMHLGVPCLVSNRVGCQRDLVTDGETGWVFDSEDREAMSRKLTIALSTVRDQTTRNRMQIAVAARVAQFTYTQATDGLEALLAQTFSHS